MTTGVMRWITSMIRSITFQITSMKLTMIGQITSMKRTMNGPITWVSFGTMTGEMIMATIMAMTTMKTTEIEVLVPETMMIQLKLLVIRLETMRRFRFKQMNVAWQ